MNEKESLQIEIPLDPAHRRMELALRESEIDVEDVISEELTPHAEKKLHDLLQSKKYEDRL